jgi:hypothetical protein
VIRSTYQVVVPNFDMVIAEMTLDQNVSRFDQFEMQDDRSYKQAASWFLSVKEWHKAKASLNDYSLHDVGLMLAHWEFTPDGNKWVVSHPISGEFSDVSLKTDGSGRPTLSSRLTAIVTRVLPPSTWGFAESEAPEEITVHCIVVSGADSYNVYNDLGGGNFELLGNVPDNDHRTLVVTAGYYRVRIAAVVSGVVGVLGNENVVQVAVASAQASAEPASVITTKPEKLTTRIKEWLGNR